MVRIPDAYILRPPYLYGPMNNVYREAFVFDCARKDSPFYLPGNGDMKLQFFHIEDLCKLIQIIIDTKPSEHIMNVGNSQCVSIRDWITKCYACFNKTPSFVNVPTDIEQRSYFPFYNYEYCLDVHKQQNIYENTIPLETGLRESSDWYLANEAEVKKKPFFDYINQYII